MLFKLNSDFTTDWSVLHPEEGNTLASNLVVRDDGVLAMAFRSNTLIGMFSHEGNPLWNQTVSLPGWYEQAVGAGDGITMCGVESAASRDALLTRLLFTDGLTRSLDLVPNADPVIVPAGGGTINFMINYSSPLPLEFAAARLRVTHQSGQYADLIYQPNFPLPQGDYSIPFLTYIPANAPAGDYELAMIAGPVDSPVLMDSFPFTKEGAAVTANRPLSSDGWRVGDMDRLLAVLNGEEVASQRLRPTEPTLGKVTPNPFNPGATVTLALPEAATLQVTVHDILGREVVRLAHGAHAAGTHQFILNGSGWSSGVYFVRAAAGDWQATQRVVLLK